MNNQQEYSCGRQLKRNMQRGEKTRTMNWMNYVGFVIDPCNLADKEEEDPAPWLEIVQSDNTQQSVDREIHNFMDYMQPLPEEIAIREDLVRRFRFFMHSTFNNGIIVSPFGSYVTGLYLPSSDIDIVLTLPPNGKSPKAQLTVILAAIKASGFASDVEDVLQASVPLIRFKDRLTTISIDLTASDVHALRSTAAVQKWMQGETEIKRMLIIVVKRFLSIRRCSTTYTGGINSYLLVWMVVAWVTIEWPKIKALTPTDATAVSAPGSINIPHGTGGAISDSTDPLQTLFEGINLNEASQPESTWRWSNPAVLELSDDANTAIPPHLIPDYSHALLHFFKFYGRTFRYQSKAIEIEPRPRYTTKPRAIGTPTYLFSITDPADASIDMGSRAYGIKHIQATFSAAYTKLLRITQSPTEQWVNGGLIEQFPHGVLHDLLYN